MAHLMGQYCFARWRLSSSVTMPAGWAGRPPGVWTVGTPAARRVGGDSVQWASMVTSRHMVTSMVILNKER